MILAFVVRSRIEFIKTAARADVELVVTHASVIFLTSDRAFKLKRAVR